MKAYSRQGNKYFLTLRKHHTSKLLLWGAECVTAAMLLAVLCWIMLPEYRLANIWMALLCVFHSLHWREQILTQTHTLPGLPPWIWLKQSSCMVNLSAFWGDRYLNLGIPEFFSSSFMYHNNLFWIFRIKAKIFKLWGTMTTQPQKPCVSPLRSWGRGKVDAELCTCSQYQSPGGSAVVQSWSDLSCQNWWHRSKYCVSKIGGTDPLGLLLASLQVRIALHKSQYFGDSLNTIAQLYL